MKLPDWWDEAPRWEHREVADHFDPRQQSLDASFLDTPVPLDEALDRRQRGEPLEYILGHCHVDEITVKTDRRALIPRLETETLVRRFCDHDSQLPSGPVLDCGTGSGFIAGWLSKFTDRMIVASDVSESALSLARENRQLNDWSYQLIRADRVRPFRNLAGVVANLPYVQLNSPRLSSSVEQYEPAKALFPDDSPLDFYRECLDQLEGVLKQGGEAWLEFEPENIHDLKQSAVDRSCWNSVEVLRDQSDTERFLRLTFEPGG